MSRVELNGFPFKVKILRVLPKGRNGFELKYRHYFKLFNSFLCLVGTIRVDLTVRSGEDSLFLLLCSH